MYVSRERECSENPYFLTPLFVKIHTTRGLPLYVNLSPYLTEWWVFENDNSVPTQTLSLTQWSLDGPSAWRWVDSEVTWKYWLLLTGGEQ